MTKLRVAVVLIAVSILLGGSAGFLSSCSGPYGSARVVRTSGKELAWMQNALAAHLKEVRPGETGKVRFVTDGFFVGPDEGSEFVLGEGGSFRSRADEHSGMTFRVKRVVGDGVEIEYESLFDHRSFGKDMISIDRGTVKITWHGGPA